MGEPHPPEPTTAHLPGPPVVRPPAPRQKGRGRRIGRAVGLGIAALFGLVLLAIVLGLVWLHTGNGARSLGIEVTKQAQQAIQGRLAVSRIEVRGFLEVCADAVDLRDPDGIEVLRAERACVHVNPIALKAHKIMISELRLVRPWIDIATVTGPDGKPTTTLSRALAPREPPQPDQQKGPFAWVIDVTGISLEQGSVAMRPAPKETPSFALDRVDVRDGRAHYAADKTAAALALSGQLLQPGKLPIAVGVDATVDGPTNTGKLDLREARISAGKSGARASGSLDLGTRRGTVEIRDLRLFPEDLDALSRGKPGALSGEVRGQATVRLEGQRVVTMARLEAGGGKVALDADATLDQGPRWSVALQLDDVDPAAVARAGPNGKVTGRVEANGKGTPTFDEHGVRGDMPAPPPGAPPTGPAPKPAGTMLSAPATIVVSLPADATLQVDGVATKATSDLRTSSAWER